MAVIELPLKPAPNTASIALVDAGFTLKGAAGGAMLRVDRAGSHYRASIGFPVMPPETARLFVARLQRAKAQGLRIPYPLLGQDQGAPGNPVVDGAGQAGTTLAVRGLTPNYPFAEGFWLSIEDASGQHYLHSLAASGAADGAGLAQLSIWPALRAPFADGALVHLARPMLEGYPLGEASEWAVATGGLFTLGFEIEEKG